MGHAKSMHMNFKLAFEKLGVPPEQRETFFRYGTAVLCFALYAVVLCLFDWCF